VASVRIERYGRPMHSYADLGVSAAWLAELRAAAQGARKANYSPYSGFMVLAAAETHEGGIYAGTNVENVNYSLTKHAEEVAVLAALMTEAEQEDLWIKTLYVTSASPCGSCRQFVAEFGRAETVVLIDRIGQEQVRTAALAELNDDSIEAWKLGDLLPAAFAPTDLEGTARA
jgi:cytidine deaminase